MQHRRRRRPAPLQGAIQGLFAGLLASYAMNQFQAALAALGAAPEDDGDPATVKAAETLAGHAIAEPDKPRAGNTVHYSFGALLGAIYGAGAEIMPGLAMAGGVPFGLAAMAVADEGLVPAAGLSAPARESPPQVHVYSAAAHVVFGLALDASRRVLRWTL